MKAKLVANSYGKTDVRLTKVVRNGKKHSLAEYSVKVHLTGDFIPSYTDGDNRKVIATDTIKNTVYVVAKENKFDSAEDFAILLANHFPNQYKQVKSATVEITEARWKRIKVKGKPHEHSFVNGGSELHTCVVSVAKKGKTPHVVGGVTNLHVIKTTNSAWKDFYTDRYRTLKDTSDRILGTSVTATWEYGKAKVNFAKCTETIRNALLESFAVHNSLGAQHTMYDMGKAALAAVPEIKSIYLRLPNKHRIPFNLDPFGLKFEGDIFVWTDEPYGDITALIERD
ncbi:urate oxidase [soil metagenome]